MKRTGIVLAGGASARFGQDKGLLSLGGKPLITHVLNAIDNIVDEKLVIISSVAKEATYRKAVNGNASIFVDAAEVHGPFVGALEGFRQARGKYSLLLPCDTPFVSTDILLLLFELCTNRNAAIPRRPNCYVEPLQAVYFTRAALQAAEKAWFQGKLNMQAMVDRLRSVRYVSTLVLEQLDPELRTFFNVNTPFDLKKAERLLSRSERRTD